MTDGPRPPDFLHRRCPHDRLRSRPVNFRKLPLSLLPPPVRRRSWTGLAALGAALGAMAGLVAGCDSLPGSGPSTSDVTAAARPTPTGETRFALIDLDPRIVGIVETWKSETLQATFGADRFSPAPVIGEGDVVQVAIWESSSGLFTPPAINERGMSAGARGGATGIPEQTVGFDGRITVPYAGRVQAAGRTPAQVETAIKQALEGQAVKPEVLVVVTKNLSNTVTVVGEVTSGARVPLTQRGDRLLDVIAAAGGTKAPAHEILVTLVRGRVSASAPLQTILTNPAENVPVRKGDVVSVARDPKTFTAAGATGANAVVPFEMMELTLDQAIARTGGLNDSRADPTGVFVIRYETPENYDQLGLRRPDPGTTPQRIPVIYRVNMREPNSFFLARRFPIRSKDIVFVANASSMELQKVMQILLPFIGTGASAVVVGNVIAR